MDQISLYSTLMLIVGLFFWYCGIIGLSIIRLIGTIKERKNGFRPDVNYILLRLLIVLIVSGFIILLINLFINGNNQDLFQLTFGLATIPIIIIMMLIIGIDIGISV